MPVELYFYDVRDMRSTLCRVFLYFFFYFLLGLLTRGLAPSLSSPILPETHLYPLSVFLTFISHAAQPVCLFVSHATLVFCFCSPGGKLGLNGAI